MGTGSGLIWDLEHTCRFWQTDGLALRYLMFAARCKYRQPGGHSTSYGSVEARVVATDREINTLAVAFPEWAKYTPLKYQSTSAFNYSCIAVGGFPLKLKMPDHSRQIATAPFVGTYSPPGCGDTGIQSQWHEGMNRCRESHAPTGKRCLHRTTTASTRYEDGHCCTIACVDLL